jgi:hypothetical protein
MERILPLGIWVRTEKSSFIFFWLRREFFGSREIKEEVKETKRNTRSSQNKRDEESFILD